MVDLEAPCPDFFTERHQNLMELLAGRIAVSIENASFTAAAYARRERWQLLNEISRELSSVLLNELFP